MLSLSASAQNAGEKLVEFFSSNATMEDDPNKQTYNITIFSPDGEWKMQLHYKSESMFGTFGNDDFELSGSGKNYNFARNPKNDMVFYSFTDMNVTVADEGTLYRVKANCLTNNKTRFVVEATIDAPKPTVIKNDNLGYARVEPNSFYGTWGIYAENDNYKLGYGVVGENLLGTFYRADLLMPELFDKKANKSLNILNATAWHTQDGDNTHFKIEILDEDHVMYSLTMFNGPYDLPIVGEESIEMWSMALQDLTEMYGCYQFGAMNEEYGLAIAVKPDVFESGRTSWTKDDFLMQFTKLVALGDNYAIEIFDIKAETVKEGDDVMMKADVTGMDGIVYHVTMHMAKDGPMPEAKDTVNIDFGQVRILDYSQGLGTIGVGAFVPDKYQMRFYFNAYELDGNFTTSDFYLDMCDMMVVNGNLYQFHDGKYVNAKMEKEESGRIRITADMLCVDDVLYHATMYVDPLKCLEGGDYTIDMQDDVTMVSVLAGTANDYSEYMLQLQNFDTDMDGNIVGDGYYFSFYLGHKGPGIGGEYGYAAGTLFEGTYHSFYENGCEVRVASVAGTLKLEPVQQCTLNLPMGVVNTCLYNISFQVLGQNGAIYNAQGGNILICIDEEGNLVDIDEDMTGIIKQKFEEESGQRVRKVLKNGKVILKTPTEQYDMQGRRIKNAS